MSKIKYLQVLDKVYQVTSISFYYMKIEAKETELSATDVPADELFDWLLFKDYGVKLVNNGGQAKIIDFTDWKTLYIERK